MKFDDLDRKMRVYETTHDYCVPPGNYLVARIDGRNFTRLTKEHNFDKPYDIRFRDCMVGTVKHLMHCGFNVKYGYTQSDEISLLFDSAENAFGRKPRKYQSILAGEASAKFSLLIGNIGVFDCRISVLPMPELMVDYFRWRHEDACRNALNSHCYWLLRNNGSNARSATSFLDRKSVAEKNEFLFQRGVNFNDLPDWQKRGVGLYWEDYIKAGINPLTQDKSTVSRRQIVEDYQLPMRDEYSSFITSLLQK